MSQALDKFKTERPEEYQEYRAYKRKYGLINIGFFAACLGAFVWLLLSVYFWKDVKALTLLPIGAIFGLWRLHKKFSHQRSVLRLSIAIMEMTFEDPEKISDELKDELRDIFDS